MAEYSISSANLDIIENNISILSNQLSHVANGIDVVNDLVNVVDSKVNSVSASLTALTDEFKTFANESRRIAILSDAKHNIVMLEQEIEKEYGYYDNIRRHTVGILQAADINVVRKETITNITEEMMISAPRYWLAPALIALSAWLSDDRELAERALKEAMRRDDEKTSLMFCLISRRAGRMDGSLVWLERYFAMQDPTKMERKIIVVLDAFASGLFGPDSKGLCSDKIKSWLEELSSRVGFVEEQKNQWSRTLLGKKVSLDQELFPYLKQFSPTWPKLQEVLEWAETHDDIHQYFSKIFNTHMDNAVSLSAKIDDLLDSLVTNYDSEELPLRLQLRRNRLIIEENGNLDKANFRLGTEEFAYNAYEDFSQHLTSIALTPESSGALVATQKLAISLSKDWISNAYEDLTVKSRSEVPLDVQLDISGWSSSTRDGSNETELQESLNAFIDDIKKKAVSSIKWFRMNVVLAIIIGVIVGYLGGSTIVVPILSIAAVVVYILIEKSKADKNIKATKEQMEELRTNSLTALNASLAEIVDYRRLYAEKDSDYTKVADFFQALKPERYISAGNTQKIRQVI